MNLGEKYRAWKEQWPEASKWALPLWLGCAALLGTVVWRGFRDWRGSVAEATATKSSATTAEGTEGRPAWVDRAAGIARIFPIDPDLWRQAARLLIGTDVQAARNLWTRAATVQPASAATNEDLSAALAMKAITTAAASTEAVRAFGLEDGPADRELVHAVLQRGETGSATAEARLAQLCAGEPSRAAAYAGWLVLRNELPQALAWIDGLSPSVAAAPRIRMLRAELLGRLGDFKRMRSELAQGALGPAQGDAIDLALGAGLAEEQGREALGRDLWVAAIAACGQKSEEFTVVLRIALLVGVDQESSRSFEAALARIPTEGDLAREFQNWRRLPRGTAVGGAFGPS